MQSTHNNHQPCHKSTLGRFFGGALDNNLCYWILPMINCVVLSQEFKWPSPEIPDTALNKWLESEWAWVCLCRKWADRPAEWGASCLSFTTTIYHAQKAMRPGIQITLSLYVILDLVKRHLPDIHRGVNKGLYVIARNFFLLLLKCSAWLLLNKICIPLFRALCCVNSRPTAKGSKEAGFTQPRIHAT